VVQPAQGTGAGQRVRGPPQGEFSSWDRNLTRNAAAAGLPRANRSCRTRCGARWEKCRRGVRFCLLAPNYPLNSDERHPERRPRTKKPWRPVPDGKLGPGGSGSAFIKVCGWRASTYGRRIDGAARNPTAKVIRGVEGVGILYLRSVKGNLIMPSWLSLKGKYTVTDIDGCRYTYQKQERTNSCGVVCAMIVKELHQKGKPIQFPEVYFRNVAFRAIEPTNFDSQTTDDGIPASPEDLERNDLWYLNDENGNPNQSKWDNSGLSYLNLLSLLKARPYPITLARQRTSKYCYKTYLELTTRAQPTIIGFVIKDGQGHYGHYVVCLGPTKTNRDLCVILDPASGLGYLDLSKVNGSKLGYYLAGSTTIHGEFAPNGDATKHAFITTI